MHFSIKREVDIQITPRVQQMSGIFDLTPAQKSGESWTHDIELPPTWNVGLIVGPSGAGKTTLAREMFGADLVTRWEWPHDKSLLDGFPKGMGIKDIVELLNSVGFSSPPSWVRPFHVLSNGEQFRVELARTLAEKPTLAVVDEFTSVVDRTVAQIGSAAVAKTVRKRGGQFVAVSCHYDIAAWLSPDWVYQPHTGQLELARGRLQRPSLTLQIQRVDSAAWLLFRKHHYLDGNLNESAHCFCAFLEERPVAFCAVLHQPNAHARNLKREHRVVTLPDYQGVGIGNALSDYLAGAYKALGYRYLSITSHPSMMQRRARSPLWTMKRQPAATTNKNGKNAAKGLGAWQKKIVPRLRTTFEYVGPAVSKEEATRLILG